MDKTIEFYYDNWVVDSNTVKIDIDGDGTEEEVLEEVVLTKTDLVFVSEQADYDVVNITDYFIKRYPTTLIRFPTSPSINTRTKTPAEVPKRSLPQPASPLTNHKAIFQSGFYPSQADGPKSIRMVVSIVATLPLTS